VSGRRVRARVLVCALGGLLAVPAAAAPAQAKAGISITAVPAAAGGAGAGARQVAVAAFGGDDAAGRQRLCVQRRVGAGWRTAVCGPVELGTGGWVRVTLPRTASGATWFRALLQRIEPGPGRRPETDLVSGPVTPPAGEAALLETPCEAAQWQTTSRSAVSLSSVDNGIETASVVRSK
jgi:hypothetical protein